MTPIVKITVKGLNVYTVDTAGLEELQASSPSSEQAEWVAMGLAWAHNVPFERQS